MYIWSTKESRTDRSNAILQNAPDSIQCFFAFSRSALPLCWIPRAQNADSFHVTHSPLSEERRFLFILPRSDYNHHFPPPVSTRHAAQCTFSCACLICLRATIEISLLQSVLDFFLRPFFSRCRSKWAPAKTDASPVVTVIHPATTSLTTYHQYTTRCLHGRCVIEPHDSARDG